MKITFISDTHNSPPLRLPECDVLIHSGDATRWGERSEVEDFAAWFRAQEAAVKVFVPGNHDILFETDEALARSIMGDEVITLIHEPATIVVGDTRVKLFGSPWTPRFRDWAFNADPAQLPALWGAIPDDTDILITHGPPFAILDANQFGVLAGCRDLAAETARVDPVIHAFGHIHECGGQYVEYGKTLFVNAACRPQTFSVRPTLKVIHD